MYDIYYATYDQNVQHSVFPVLYSVTFHVLNTEYWFTWNIFYPYGIYPVQSNIFE